ncbi:MAG: class I SAM-dependent methyltransferase [Blastocatellia bacterium]
MSDRIKDNLDLRESVNRADEAKRDELLTHGWWHSIDLGDGRITPGAKKIDELRDHYACFNLPDDLTGKRVLDIGCWDGFFSFEAERRGAEVVAVDCWRPEKFFEAHSILNSRVEFREMSVYEITREKLGRFDIVFFLGVIYHLQHPLLALQRVCEVTCETAVIESHVIDDILDTSRPVMEYYEYEELGGQYDNWWGPNTDCLIRMTRTAGFARAEVIRREPARSIIKAYRNFADLPIEFTPSIRILDVINACTFEHHFPRRGRRAFLQIWADEVPKQAGRENLRVVVEGCGATPTYVGQVEGIETESTCRKVINVPVPPGLGTGPAMIWMFCEGQVSNQFRIDLRDGSEW